MYKIFKSELYKMSTPLKIISVVVGIITLVGLVSFLQYYMQFKDMEETSIEMFMTLNLRSILISFILPIIMIVITSTSFAEEYDLGMIKSYLLCGVDKKDIYGGKVLYLNIVLLSIVLMMYLGLYFAGSIIVNDTSFNQNIFKYLPEYMYTGVAIELTILLTILFSLILENSNKTIVVSMVVMFLSMAMDSVLQGKFYTTTSFISNMNLVNQNDIADYKNSIILFLVYMVVLNITNLVYFKNKDIWR